MKQPGAHAQTQHLAEVVAAARVLEALWDPSPRIQQRRPSEVLPALRVGQRRLVRRTRQGWVVLDLRGQESGGLDRNALEAWGAGSRRALRPTLAQLHDLEDWLRERLREPRREGRPYVLTGLTLAGPGYRRRLDMASHD